MAATRDAEGPSETSEDWDLLVSFLPDKWAELAGETGSLKGLRKDKSVDRLLRTLLIHLLYGHSLRGTAVRARMADLSDVALLKRLRKSKAWPHALCAELFREQGFDVPARREASKCVPFDATTVRGARQDGIAVAHALQRQPAFAGL